MMIHKESDLSHRREISKTLYTCIFVFVVGWMAWGVLYFWSIRYHSSDYFDFLNHLSDRFRDFSEVNLAAMQGAPYILGKCSNYPPLALLLGKVFSSVYPEHFVSLNPWDVRNSAEGDLLFSVVFGLCVVLIMVLILYWTGKKTGLRIPDRLLVMAMCILSAPLIFAIDRGNYVIFAYIAFLLFAVTFEDHEILSGIALAVCACLKIYPAIFCVVFLFSRKYKGFIACIITGIFGLVVPFAFFEGNILDQFQGFLDGCFGFSDAVLTYSNPEAPFAYVEQKSNSFSNIFRALSMVAFYAEGEKHVSVIVILEWVSKVLTVGIIALIGYVVIANKDVWKKLLALVIFSIIIPGNTFNYMLLFLQPFVIRFCINPSSFSNLYVALLTAISFVPKNWYYFSKGAPDVSIECVLNPLLLTLVVFVLTWDTYKNRRVVLENKNVT